MRLLEINYFFQYKSGESVGGGDVNESENVVKNDQMALKYGFATGTGIHIVVQF